MHVPIVLLYLSMFIFLAPPIRQFRERFFYYFLILALEDPFAWLLLNFIKIPVIITHLFFTVMLIFAVTKRERFIKYSPYGVLLMIPLSIGTIFLSSDNMRIVLAAFHIFIFFAIIKYTVEYTREKRSINFFQVALILYESTIILKFVDRVLDIKNGITFFYITLGFELFIGIFFTIFKEDNKFLCFTIPSFDEAVKVNSENEYIEQ
jgi:hypothetical protein